MYARPTTRYAHMTIVVRLNSTSCENQGDLSSKHKKDTIDNDPSTSATYPHDEYHYRHKNAGTCSAKPFEELERGRSFPFVEAQRLLVAIRIVTEEVLLIDGDEVNGIGSETF